jgi:hypothetical protein
VGFQFNHIIQNLSCQTYIYSLLLLFYNYFPVDSFGGSSDLAGTGSTIFSGGLFWRELKLSGNWLHIIFRQIVLEVGQIWRELAPHFFPTDCFGGSSNLEGTGSTLFSGGLFWKFGGNWLHIVFWRIVSE